MTSNNSECEMDFHSGVTDGGQWCALHPWQVKYKNMASM